MPSFPWMPQNSSELWLRERKGRIYKISSPIGWTRFLYFSWDCSRCGGGGVAGRTVAYQLVRPGLNYSYLPCNHVLPFPDSHRPSEPHYSIACHPVHSPMPPTPLLQGPQNACTPTGSSRPAVPIWRSPRSSTCPKHACPRWGGGRQMITSLKSNTYATLPFKTP